jgi:hypothetical protein
MRFGEVEIGQDEGMQSLHLKVARAVTPHRQRSNTIVEHTCAQMPTFGYWVEPYPSGSANIQEIQGGWTDHMAKWLIPFTL